MAEALHPLSPVYIAQDRGPVTVATMCAATGVSTAFVVARIYVRSRIMRKVYYDDYLIVFSLLCGWASVAFTVEAVKSGGGRHMDTLTNDQITGAILWTTVGFWPGILSFAIPKITVVALLIRILSPGTAHRVFLWTSTLLCVASLNVCIPLQLTSCKPTRSLWDMSITKKSCRNEWILVYYSVYAGSFSAAVDLYLAVYPATVLFTLQMKLKKKIALSFALGIGSIASVVAIYKTTRLSVLASPDFSYETPALSIWTSIEGSTLIIATCIPTLQPLLEVMRGRKRRMEYSSARRQWYGSSRGGQHKSDMGLEYNRRVVRPRNELDTIMNTGCDDTESQEYILAPYEIHRIHARVDGIVKTEEVSITYGEKAAVHRSKDHPANWRPE